MGKLIGHGVYEHTDKDTAIKECDQLKQRDPLHVAEFRPCSGDSQYYVATERYIRAYHLGEIIYSAEEVTE